MFSKELTIIFLCILPIWGKHLESLNGNTICSDPLYPRAIKIAKSFFVKCHFVNSISNDSEDHYNTADYSACESRWVPIIIYDLN